MSEKTPFQRLREINVNDKTEKKGNLTYLSWAWAVDQLLTADHLANWEYLEPLMFGETVMVRCAVTAFGKTMVAQLPVMDHRNKPIPHPDAFAVNTAMQRCLVKAIALHGLGLYIYAGEDLPDGEDKPEAPKNTPTQIMRDEFDNLTPEQQKAFMQVAENTRAQLDSGNVDEGYRIYSEFRDTLEDTAHQAALRSLFSSAEKSAMMKHHNKLQALKKEAA